MKLLEILQKELKEFPDGMLYAVQDDDGEVKFGKGSKLKLAGGIWQRYESGNCPRITGLELAEDWDSSIVTKEMWKNDREKQIIVNVAGLTIEEKQRVNEALAKVTGAHKLQVINPEAAWLFAPSPSGLMMVTCGWDYHKDANQTHTPQQVLEMAGMAKQGHIHAHLMALYAEDAKTTDKPWELWQVKDKDGVWWECKNNPLWGGDTEYRRKPKTHIVNGVEVPDLRIVPNEGEEHYLPDPLVTHLYKTATNTTYQSHCHRVSNNLCYEHTEEGKQAAILHAKAWLGMVK